MQRMSPPNSVGPRASAPRRTRDSRCIRYWITSATERMCSPCSRANRVRSGMRAMVPSSFITSQITPAGISPASRQRSTLPSVCPARTSTPPLRARSGKTCPGRTTSSGFASGSIAARMVVARSCALIPVVTPLAASMLTVKAVVYVLWFSLTLMERPSLFTCSSVKDRQIRPRAFLAMKLMASGVTNCAASTRSPSFSRSASSTRMTMRPLRSSSSAFSTRAIVCSTALLLAAPPGGGYAAIVFFAAGPHQASDVLAEDIRLDIHLRACPFDAPGGGAQSLGNDEQRDAVGVQQGVDGQGDAVQRDGALGDHQAGEPRGQPQLHQRSFADHFAADDLSDTVHVPQDEMAARAIAEGEWPLQVPPVACFTVSQCALAQCLGADVGPEAIAGQLDRREADAVHGDARSMREPRQPGPHRQAHTLGHTFDRRHGSDVLDQTGEHRGGIYNVRKLAACLNVRAPPTSNRYEDDGPRSLVRCTHRCLGRRFPQCRRAGRLRTASTAAGRRRAGAPAAFGAPSGAGAGSDDLRAAAFPVRPLGGYAGIRPRLGARRRAARHAPPPPGGGRAPGGGPAVRPPGRARGRFPRGGLGPPPATGAGAGPGPTAAGSARRSTSGPAGPRGARHCRRAPRPAAA